MKRAIIFSSATAAGLAGVLAFHTAPVSLAVGGLVTGAAGTSGQTGGNSSTTTSLAASSTTTPPTTNPSTTTTSSPKSSTTSTTTRPKSTTTSTTTTAPPVTTTTSAPTGTRTVTGQAVNYYFGVLSVSVTATGKKITNVTIGQLSDGGNYRSQQIDQMSVPLLEQETMQSQNSQIQSVSGASYTSAGFVMSLQSALKKLGI
jgi:uncharacterized protein with FMN-binding domain